MLAHFINNRTTQYVFSENKRNKFLFHFRTLFSNESFVALRSFISLFLSIYPHMYLYIRINWQLSNYKGDREEVEEEKEQND